MKADEAMGDSFIAAGVFHVMGPPDRPLEGGDACCTSVDDPATWFSDVPEVAALHHCNVDLLSADDEIWECTDCGWRSDWLGIHVVRDLNS